MRFFESLPDFQSDPTVFERDDVIGLIPLFDDAYFNMFPSYLKSAIYSRQSWLLNSDAVDQKIAIKFYIEDVLKDIALPILERNGLSEADVLWFSAPQLPDTTLGVWGRFGKKLCLYWDPQLAHYEKIVYWDADTFKLPGRTRNMFARAADEVYFSFVRTVTSERRIWRPQMIRRSAKNVYLGGLPIQDIFARAGLGRVLQEIRGYLTLPVASLCVYPASTFRSEHSDCLDWIRNHGPYIGSDEVVIGLAAKRFPFYLNSLRREWGVTSVNVYDYLKGDTDHTCLHGKPIPAHEADYRNMLVKIRPFGNSDPTSQIPGR